MEKDKNKKVLRVRVGDIDRIPKELKHLDTSKQVSKHKFPQDRWENTLVAGCVCTHDLASRYSSQRVPKTGPMSTTLTVIG